MTPGLIAVVIIAIYLSLLLGLGLMSKRFFRGTASDYFLASRGIGSFLLLMSLFGTTMTAFALVGSSGAAFLSGIGVYGKMASWSGIVHSACFFLVGMRLWSFGKRYGYVTQIQFFRDRFSSDAIGLLLFPILVGLVIPYLLIGVLAAGTTIQKVTAGAFPEIFAATSGGIPFWMGSGTICLVVLVYVFFGGVRGTAWANAFQTIVFLLLGMVAFTLVSQKLGGLENASAMVLEHNPTRMQRGVSAEDRERYESRLAQWEADKSSVIVKPREPEPIGQLQFLSYFFIPFSVGMFPHLFQHWLTAKSAKSFKLSIIAHPLLIMVVWVPCVLLGVWATSAVYNGEPVIPPGFSNSNAVLAVMVKKLTNPYVGGLLTAGILAAIMSSLDSQFLCIGSIFTNDIVSHYLAKDTLSDRARVMCGRIFVIFVVSVTYGLALYLQGTRSVFSLAVWCFTGFAGLFPIVMAALYWRRATAAGAMAAILAMAGSWTVLFYMSNFGKDLNYRVFDIMPVAIIFGASTAALIRVSLVTRPPDDATLAKFFARRGV